MKYRIGVIGATGYIGVPYRREIRSASQDAQIVAVCARRRDRLQAAASEDGATLVTDDWRQVVEHPDINFVLVLTPDALHYEPVMACAELGKHVLCEKPIGKDVNQARAMWRAASEHGIASFVPFWNRYVPIFQRARLIVASGRLGEVRAVVYRWHNPRPLGMPYTWRDDARQSAAGSIADIGSHAYDMLRFILGQEATRVLTHAEVLMPAKSDLGHIDLTEALDAGRRVDKTDGGDSADRDEHTSSHVAAGERRASVPDYAQIAVEFADGAVGSILLSQAGYLRKVFAPELELHGTRGSISVDRLRRQIWFANQPDPATLLQEVVEDGHCNRFQSHVFPAIESQLKGAKNNHHADLADGLAVQKFTDAAFISSTQGRWVEVNSA